ncbi:hypothetical protein E1301_Tti009045 [Triplophysa tibetana]|uniref:Uncharacterized protein n=1 Tax=Triplophysa tibetana TaxID=1572043 RepID=A0A5A9P4I1_9TELE|nr:hypothetical protein E1301_Tti009045 [Triplophysa tibetana]
MSEPKYMGGAHPVTNQPSSRGRYSTRRVLLELSNAELYDLYISVQSANQIHQNSREIEQSLQVREFATIDLAFPSLKIRHSSNIRS